MSEWIVKPIFDKDGACTGYEKKGDLVRCKHCRKWTNGDDTYGTCQWNEYRTLQTRFDDFCSYGERRT